jgi:hypothetical protein
MREGNKIMIELDRQMEEIESELRQVFVRIPQRFS